MSDATTTVMTLRGLMRDFVAERQWEKFHDPKNLSMSIAIEAAELMEHFQWARSEDVPSVITNPAIRGEILDEIADIQCFLLALANTLNIDLADSVARKMEKNRAKYPAEQFRGRYEKPRGG